jgi:hypothetical protein
VLKLETERATNVAFSRDSRIEDPRGLHIHPGGAHLYVNSGNDRVLLVDAAGMVTAATPSIPGLNPGRGVVAPDGLRGFADDANDHRVPVGSSRCE